MANIFTVIPQFLDLFKKGKEVANAEAWKAGTIAVNTIVAFLGAALTLAKNFGYNLGIDDATLQQFAVGIASLAGLFNAIMHVITSARVGLSSGNASSPAGK
jgi:hypothetical protein